MENHLNFFHFEPLNICSSSIIASTKIEKEPSKLSPNKSQFTIWVRKQNTVTISAKIRVPGGY
uniref:Putative ovule protein n=1 Tax=Solanum chacoense TaxID=4108 RepID=A0A0V0IAP6_SOLCH